MWKLVMLWSGASLLIRSECLLLLIIIIIILLLLLFFTGKEYRIYSKEIGGKGGKGGKSCPEYSKVLHERDF